MLLRIFKVMVRIIMMVVRIIKVMVRMILRVIGRK